MAAATSDALVIFGITGDLARRMTFRALYRLERRGLLTARVVGVAKDDLGPGRLAALVGEAVESSGEPVDPAVLARLTGRLDYLAGDFADPATYTALAARLTGCSHPVFYLEIPPALFGPVVARLAEAGLTAGARVAVEKPFGHDLPSARALDADLHRHLDESQLLRIDHFLGKEPVMDIQFLRFANTLLGQVWGREHVSAVQVTMAENFGVEQRGAFYDPVGALRDVVQNHLLQVLALVAMDPPVGAAPDDLHDKTAEVFRAIPPADPHRCVRGQYQGYLDVEGVAPGSRTETYVALRLEVDSWRWAGVPFFLRAGKALAERVTEVRLFLHRPPRLAFLPTPSQAEPNQIVLRIDPEAGLRIQLVSKAGDGLSWRPVHLDMSFAAELGEPLEPYERLLSDAMAGDRRLFARQDSVLETWRIVQPLLEDPAGCHPYPSGSWGPSEADALVRGHPGWHRPWLPGDAAAGQPHR